MTVPCMGLDVACGVTPSPWTWAQLPKTWWPRLILAPPRRQRVMAEVAQIVKRAMLAERLRQEVESDIMFLETLTEVPARSEPFTHPEWITVAPWRRWVQEPSGVCDAGSGGDAGGSCNGGAW